MSKMSNETALFKLASEGTGYAVTDYCSGSSLEDPETARLWDEAGDALSKLINHLETATGQSLEDY